MNISSLYHGPTNFMYRYRYSVIKVALTIVKHCQTLSTVKIARNGEKKVSKVGNNSIVHSPMLFYSSTVRVVDTFIPIAIFNLFFIQN